MTFLQGCHHFKENIAEVLIRRLGNCKQPQLSEMKQQTQPKQRRKGGLSDSLFKGAVYHGGEGMVVGAGGGRSRCIHRREAEEMKASQLVFSVFYSVQDPTPWDGPAHTLQLT